MGPFAVVWQCLPLDKPLLSNKIQGNYMELKITAYMCVGENCGQKDTKRPKIPIATSEEPVAKTFIGSKSRVLSMPPALNTTKG